MNWSKNAQGIPRAQDACSVLTCCEGMKTLISVQTEKYLNKTVQAPSHLACFGPSSNLCTKWFGVICCLAQHFAFWFCVMVCRRWYRRRLITHLLNRRDIWSSFNYPILWTTNLPCAMPFILWVPSQWSPYHTLFIDLGRYEDIDTLLILYKPWLYLISQLTVLGTCPHLAHVNQNRVQYCGSLVRLSRLVGSGTIEASYLGHQIWTLLLYTPILMLTWRDITSIQTATSKDRPSNHQIPWWSPAIPFRD